MAPRSPGHHQHALAVAVDAIRTAELDLAAAVADARTDGLSWQQIGAQIGISTNATWTRYAPKNQDGA